MRVAVIGLGYVGSVSAACLASLGHRVVGMDIDAHKVEALASGLPPVAEAGLSKLVTDAHADGRIEATRLLDEAISASDVAFVCVATPSNGDGSADESQLRNAVEAIGAALRQSGRDRYVLVVRSTCLPDTHARLQEVLESASGLSYDEGLGYVCNPEFLREGSAVEDFFHPPKVVFGTRGRAALEVCRELYPGITAETFYVEPGVASMVKYADNFFHAVKVTFGNEMGLICRELGVDPNAVMDVFCRDTKLNISARYLRPGPPFGGSCLPKDLRALDHAARSRDLTLRMLQGVYASNRYQIERLLARIEGDEPATVGFVGLAFKEGTPDLRESPYLEMVRRLLEDGYRARVYDPALSRRSDAVPENGNGNGATPPDPVGDLRSHFVNDLRALVESCDMLVVSQRLGPEAWDGLAPSNGGRVIDLVGDMDLQRFLGYEGAYW